MELDLESDYGMLYYEIFLPLQILHGYAEFLTERDLGML